MCLAPGAFIYPHPQGSKVVIVPMEDVDGKVWNYQRIFPEKLSAGDKFFLPGGRIKGLFFRFDGLDNVRAEEIFIAEGYATACSIWLAFGKAKPVYAAFNAGNLKAVTETVGKIHPNAALKVCADNDCYPRADGKIYNVGLEKGQEAAATVGGTCVWPQFSDLDRSSMRAGSAEIPKLTDFNDIHCVKGLEILRCRD